MRKLIVVIIILTGFMVGINLSRKPNGFRSYQEVLAELINDAPMKTYCDSLSDTVFTIRNSFQKK